MKNTELAAFLGAKSIHSEWDEKEVAGAYTSDLLSDAMSNAVDEGLLITIQAHKNTVAVGTLKDLTGIVICNDRPIPEDMTEAAKAERIPIFVTGEDQFTVSGRLFPILASQRLPAE